MHPNLLPSFFLSQCILTLLLTPKCRFKAMKSRFSLCYIIWLLQPYWSPAFPVHVPTSRSVLFSKIGLNINILDFKYRTVKSFYSLKKGFAKIIVLRAKINKVEQSCNSRTKLNCTNREICFSTTAIRTFLDLSVQQETQTARWKWPYPVSYFG